MNESARVRRWRHRPQHARPRGRVPAPPRPYGFRRTGLAVTGRAAGARYVQPGGGHCDDATTAAGSAACGWAGQRGYESHCWDGLNGERAPEKGSRGSSS